MNCKTNYIEYDIISKNEKINTNYTKICFVSKFLFFHKNEKEG